MAIEDKNDKQIKDLLENNSELKAIVVDFKDLNNKTLVIKSSFQEGYKMLDTFKNNWFYIAELGFSGINIIGLVNMYPGDDNYLHILWLETNKVFKKKGYSKEIIIYLKRFAQYRHMKGVMAHCQKPEDMHLFKFNNFKPIGNNSLCVKWENI